MTARVRKRGEKTRAPSSRDSVMLSKTRVGTVEITAARAGQRRSDEWSTSKSGRSCVCMYIRRRRAAIANVRRRRTVGRLVAGASRLALGRFQRTHAIFLIIEFVHLQFEEVFRAFSLEERVGQVFPTLDSSELLGFLLGDERLLQFRLNQRLVHVHADEHETREFVSVRVAPFPNILQLLHHVVTLGLPILLRNAVKERHALRF